MMDRPLNREQAKRAIVELGSSLYARGYATGSSGNLSVKLEDGTIVLTPTGASLGQLVPEQLSVLAPDEVLLAGDPPTKELFLHQMIYRERPAARGIVHLHATYSAAISCLADLDPASCIPPLTAYFAMKIGRLPLVPYYRPGDPSRAQVIADTARDHPSLLLANHGPIVSGRSLRAAADAAEELEQTAKIFLATRGQAVRPLNASQLEELEDVFGRPG